MNMAIRGIDFTAPRGSASNQREDIPQSVSEVKDHFGKEPANTASRGSVMIQREASPQVVREAKDSFTSDQHPDLRADFVMATAKRASATSKRSLAAEPAERQDNPMPFNISEWWDAKLEGDARWRYGTPPRGNANFAWIQYMLHHLAPQGSMAVDFVHLRCALVLLANGSMSSGSGCEGNIGRNPI